MKQAIRQFIQEEQGQSIVEYTLLLVIIAMGAVLVLTGLGVSLTNVYTRLKSQLDVLGAETAP